jgi:hypothetical protein
LRTLARQNSQDEITIVVSADGGIKDLFDSPETAKKSAFISPTAFESPKAVKVPNPTTTGTSDTEGWIDELGDRVAVSKLDEHAPAPPSGLAPPSGGNGKSAAEIGQLISYGVQGRFAVTMSNYGQEASVTVDPELLKQLAAHGGLGKEELEDLRTLARRHSHNEIKIVVQAQPEEPQDTFGIDIAESGLKTATDEWSDGKYKRLSVAPASSRRVMSMHNLSGAHSTTLRDPPFAIHPSRFTLCDPPFLIHPSRAPLRDPPFLIHPSRAPLLMQSRPGTRCMNESFSSLTVLLCPSRALFSLVLDPVVLGAHKSYLLASPLYYKFAFIVTEAFAANPFPKVLCGPLCVA